MPRDKRIFITIAVDMPDHPKLAALSGAQMWNIVEALCYSRKYTTDGVIDLPVWRKKFTKRNRDAILETGFAVEFRAGAIVSGPDEIRTDSGKVREVFERTSGRDLPTDCVLFLDYLEHQQSRAEIEATQEQRSSAGKKGGQASGESRRETGSKREANASAKPKQTGSRKEPELELEREVLTNVSTHAHLSDAGATPEARGAKVPNDGWKLIREAVPNTFPQATKTALALQAGQLLKAGTEPDIVREALKLWMAKPNAGPGLLPHLAADALKARTATPKRDAATEKALGWLALAPDLEPGDDPHQPNQLPALKELR